MRACIHRGTQEIGGTCIELESQGKRVVLDVGLPLDVADPDQFPLHPIKGFDKADDSLLGVVISHPHQDHFGLAYRLPKQTPFLIGKAAERVLAAAKTFTPAGLRMERVIHLADRKPIVLGPFTITPYLVDHSAYDAYALHVEAGGASLFYSGDLRAHGRKGKLFQKLLRLPPKQVDVLLMEGTTLGRLGTGRGYPTETELEYRMAEIFCETTGMPLVWCSGQNIDRLVTVFRACIRSKRQLIIDMYTAEVLRATGNRKLPQAGWNQIKVFLPAGQRRQIKRKQAFELVRNYKRWRIYPEQLAETAPSSVMLFRPSMIGDVEQGNCLSDSRLIYSMWSGYLRNERQKPFLEWLRRRGIPLDECHTSGHAAVPDLIKLRKVFLHAPLVPIHTNERNAFSQTFGNVRSCHDGEWWQVRSPEHQIFA
jgi:ribonuclease J